MNIKNTCSCRYLWHCVHYSCLNKPVNLPRGISAIVLYYPRIQPNQKLWTLPCVVLQEPFMLGKNILKSYLPQVDWLRNSPAPLSGVWDEGQRRSKNIRVSGSGQKSTNLYRFDQDHFSNLFTECLSALQIMTHIQDLFLIHLPFNVYQKLKSWEITSFPSVFQMFII